MMSMEYQMTRDPLKEFFTLVFHYYNWLRIIDGTISEIEQPAHECDLHD